MRRFLITLAGLALLESGETAGPVWGKTADCQDYCAERAATRCDRVDSWGCTWYIVGCLAGCGVASL